MLRASQAFELTVDHHCQSCTQCLAFFHAEKSATSDKQNYCTVIIQLVQCTVSLNLVQCTVSLLLVQCTVSLLLVQCTVSSKPARTCGKATEPPLCNHSFLPVRCDDDGIIFLPVLCKCIPEHSPCSRIHACCWFIEKYDGRISD